MENMGNLPIDTIMPSFQNAWKYSEKFSCGTMARFFQKCLPDALVTSGVSPAEMISFAIFEVHENSH